MSGNRGIGTLIRDAAQNSLFSLNYTLGEDAASAVTSEARYDGIGVSVPAHCPFGRWAQGNVAVDMQRPDGERLVITPNMGSFPGPPVQHSTARRLAWAERFADGLRRSGIDARIWVRIR
ncbi:hypothetical protein [Catenulispora pinisilvae]|uniref:hypothetical protein n=1 Tax=Catenulispora pinisilvae TaxID=2705253 RepID=UPI0018913608|nr:hypothetical protein [Catenulispora pinisilvae]